MPAHAWPCPAGLNGGILIGHAGLAGAPNPVASVGVNPERTLPSMSSCSSTPSSITATLTSLTPRVIPQACGAFMSMLFPWFK